MNLKIRLLKFEESETFRQVHDASFNVQAKYFKDGILPGFEDENEEEYKIENLINDPNYTVLSILDDDTFIGGAVIETKGNHEYEIFEFFIAENYQGQGIGVYALKLVENYFEDAKVFMLITPSQVVRNCVFYINKCGYKIVKVLDYNKEDNSADYLFEKQIKN